MKETEILEIIRAGHLSLPPVEFDNVRAVVSDRMDGFLDASWDAQRWHFAFEVKARSTPKTLRDVVQSIRTLSPPPKTYPLIIVPYLSGEQLEELATKNLSAVDLNGNGVLVVPGRLLVFRTGNPNRYPEKSVLKNVYRGKASMAARVFLLRQRFDAVSEIQQEIALRGGKIALSTVSKVLARLVDDLIVSRDGGRIRLLQPRKLLDALVQQYEPPKIRRQLSGKTTLEISALTKAVDLSADGRGVRVVPTGTSSISAYAVMARQGPTRFYCTDILALTRHETASSFFAETERFANVQLEETQDDTVYFDIRREEGVWASPIQTYLELMSGDKRDRETAAEVADGLLKTVS